MTEIFDFFAKHYPSITPMLAGAFVSFFIVWFYLKISNQMTGLGKEMVSLGKEMVSLDKEMVSLDKKIVSLDEKMDDRFAKVYEQFLEFSKEMNDRFMYLIEKIHPMPLRP